MSDDGSPLLISKTGAVATLTLNRPSNGNAIDVELAKCLMEAAIACDEDDSVRVVVLKGAGRMFCSGGDVASFAAVGDGLPALLKELTAYLHMAIARFARMAKPLVTVINGSAAGAGFSLAMLGDIAVSCRSAKFSLAYGALGLSPDGGSTWLLPRLVGLRRAQEIVFLNRRLSAQDAADLGLITRAVDDHVLVDEVARVIEQLADSATRAIGFTRTLFLSSLSASLEEQMEKEARAIALAARGAEAREGIDAFLAKRSACFSQNEER